ncbi:regulatory protein GemA [Puniceibacterium sp. IMCC21224]|uniref:regulatory protein GemA n=1 Tax=Puniceibacterium sp. IMCC21224 TaxID=1618204 RepID=UPI00064D9D40|nr:regulatory protein GemA [Puniceibacterium sp. IMCC21224]KMK68564.1 Protein of unknown function (DUF1018) [Puniceibacterium sp. IMCC21224]
MNHNAIINIAKAQLGLDEDDYRAMLERVTGKASLRLMSDGQKGKVLAELKRMGFRVKAGGKRLAPSHRLYIRKLWAVWKSCHRLGVIKNGSREALRAFCKRFVAPNDPDVAVDPDLLTEEQARPVIEALKAMERRGKAAS